MGIIVYIVSYILKRLLFTFSITYTILYLLIKFKLKELDNYFFDLAIGNDQLGNVSCGYLFNHLLIKKTSVHKFGNEDETISSVLGKNKLDKTFKFLGYLLDNILDKLDSNHSINSIE